jgi:hypothetical protein
MSRKPITLVSAVTKSMPMKQTMDTPNPTVLISFRTNNRLNRFDCMSLSLSMPDIIMANHEVINGMEEIPPVLKIYSFFNIDK